MSIGLSDCSGPVGALVTVDSAILMQEQSELMSLVNMPMVLTIIFQQLSYEIELNFLNFHFDRRKVTFERVNNKEGEAKNMSQCLFNNQILLTTIVDQFSIGLHTCARTDVNTSLAVCLVELEHLNLFSTIVHSLRLVTKSYVVICCIF